MIRIALWSIALVVTAFQVIDLFFSWNQASGAPQQAALAAAACAWMISFYIIARAAESITAVRKELAAFATKLSPYEIERERTATRSLGRVGMWMLIAVVGVSIVLRLLFSLAQTLPASWIRALNL